MRFLLLFFLLLPFVACKAQKNTATTISNITLPKNIQELLEKRLKNIQWISGDCDLDYQGKPMDIGASMEYRIRKDSLIWVNITKLGFSVARVKITKDSIFAINYFQKGYVAEKLDYIQKEFGLPAELPKIQDILLGNVVPITSLDSLKMMEKDSLGNFQVMGKDSLFSNLFVFSGQKDLLKTVYHSQLQAQTITINTTDYDFLVKKEPKKGKFGYLRTIEIVSDAKPDEKTVIQLEFDKFPLINIPKNIRFEIPEDYPRISIK